MEQSIFKVLQYFSFFNYTPTFDEIYCFLKTKASKGKLQAVLEKMEEKSFVTISNFKFQIENCKRYTPPQYSIQRYQISNIKYQSDKSKLKNISNLAIQQFNNWKKRFVISKSKLKNLRFRLYVKLLSLFPQIQLVGLSGTLAMMNANVNDDIDLFIITAKNRLFTGRMIAIVISYLLFVKRGRSKINQQKSEGEAPADLSKQHKDKICLNLFFDGSNLKVPKRKQTEYVAHEVLQMKPIINKNNIYEKFLWINRWVSDIFPNTVGVISNSKYQISKIHSKNKIYISYLICIFNILYFIFDIIQDQVEVLLQKLQLYFIKKHQTTEMISPSQLWFFPEDFERKIQDLHG